MQAWLFCVDGTNLQHEAVQGGHEAPALVRDCPQPLHHHVARGDQRLHDIWSHIGIQCFTTDLMSYISYTKMQLPGSVHTRSWHEFGIAASRAADVSK
jgi:hypothetical protein